MSAITDGNPNTQIFGQAVFDIKFDSPLKNKEGPEFAVFEAGGEGESFKVATVNDDGSVSNFKEYIASFTAPDSDCSSKILFAAIDLTDLGIEENKSTSSIRIDNNGAPGCCVGADISDVTLLMGNQSFS